MVGFTLIEVLVVTVIIGIILALASANYFPDDNQTARREAARLVLAFEQARDKAVLGGSARAVSIAGNRVMFWQPDDKNGWSPDSAADMQPVTLAPEFAVTGLLLGAARADADAPIVFLPEGVGIPFTLQFVYRGVTGSIGGDALGNVGPRFDAP